MASAFGAETPTPVHIPFKASDPRDDSLVTRALIAFALACAMAYGIAWCLKRFLPRLKLGKAFLGESANLVRIETVRLSRVSVMHRVKYGDRELLIGESAHGLVLLDRLLLAENEPKAEKDA